MPSQKRRAFFSRQNRQHVFPPLEVAESSTQTRICCYTHTCAHRHTHKHAIIQTCMHACAYIIHAHVRLHTFSCTCTRYTCTRTLTWTRTCTHKRSHAFSCTRTCTRTRTHTRTHTRNHDDIPTFTHAHSINTRIFALKQKLLPPTGSTIKMFEFICVSDFWIHIQIQTS